jgi:hypothetical protein
MPWGERFSGIRFDERLLVGDELIQYIIGDLGFCRLYAVAHPRGRCDTHDGRLMLRPFKHG